jgi:hypothetical protein
MKEFSFVVVQVVCSTHTITNILEFIELFVRAPTIVRLGTWVVTKIVGREDVVKIFNVAFDVIKDVLEETVNWCPKLKLIEWVWFQTSF